MDWWLFLLIFFGILIFVIFMGVPVAFAFLVVNIVVISIVMGFEQGLSMLVLSAFESLSKFTLTPIPLFVAMGALLFHSGLAMRALDVLSKLLGKIPGRLSILSIGSGTLFSALSGSSIANTSMLGSILVPEMRERGYKVPMIAGPILASGSLAMIIPPSAVAVLLGSLAGISIGDLLIAGIIPGLVMMILFLLYYMIASWLNPSSAPAYEVSAFDLKGGLKSLIVDVVPLLLLIGLVLGLFFFGFATPTEAAALGALGALIIPIFYRSMNWQVLVKSVEDTVKTSGMILLIMGTSAAFSQLLAYTGTSRELVNMIVSVDVAPIVLVCFMLIIVILLGLFIEPVAIMMITLPLFMPIFNTLEFNDVWFGIMMLICLGLGNITPPFGMLLFVMRGVVPKDISMKEIYSSAMPVIILTVLVIIFIMIFPSIATWLPSLGQ